MAVNRVTDLRSTDAWENAAPRAQLMQYSTDVSGEQEEVSRGESGGRRP